MIEPSNRIYTVCHSVLLGTLPLCSLCNTLLARMELSKSNDGMVHFRDVRINKIRFEGVSMLGVKK